jgi:hypothetical protein
MDAYALNTAATEFETIFKGELHFSDAYFVVRKSGFETVVLIANGEKLFPDDLMAKAPGVIKDVQGAGKCIAFELGTAAGFHLLRAVEGVLRLYFDVVSKGHKRPKNRNIGSYLNLMGQLNVGNPKIISALTQLKDLHRNPLMHPEGHLTTDQAIGLWGISRSLISAMLDVIPNPAPSSEIAAAGQVEAVPDAPVSEQLS